MLSAFGSGGAVLADGARQRVPAPAGLAAASGLRNCCAASVAREPARR
jgi:hypothetical protein